MVTSMVGWIFSFIEDSSYNSRAIWFQYHDHHGDNSDDESYPPSQNRQIRRFANHSTMYMTHTFPHSVATRRNYNRGSSTKAWHLDFIYCDWNLSLKIVFGIVSVLVVDIISVLIFGTVSVLVSGTVLVLFFGLSLNFPYKMMISIILRVPNLEPIWFPISVPQIIFFDFLKSIVLFRLLLNIFSVTYKSFFVRTWLFSLVLSMTLT